MFEKLIIENFQSHSHTEIEFSKKVTAFTGLNNNGKTAIFRALWKLIRNEPDGVKFIRNKPTQQTFSKITLITDRGKVTRIVKNDGSSSANMYIVENLALSPKPLEFSKFGKTGIPEEVIQTLGVSPYLMFGDIEYDMNFQHQLDTMFLVQGQGMSSVRGKVLGRIIGIDSTSRAIQLVGADEKRVTAATKEWKQQEIDLAEELKKYTDLDTVSQQYDDTNSLYKEYESKVTQLEAMKASVIRIQEQVNRAKQVNKILALVQSDFTSESQSIQIIINKLRLLRRLEGSKGYIENFNVFKTIYDSREEVLNTQKIIDIQRKLQILRNLQFISESIEIEEEILKITLPTITSIEAKRDNLNMLSKLQSSLQKTVMEANKAQTILQTTQLEYSAAEKEYEDLKIELKVCPICLRAFE
jgi:hypothetical protein